MTYQVNAGLTLATTQAQTANRSRDSNIPADLALAQDTALVGHMNEKWMNEGVGVPPSATTTLPTNQN